MPTSVRRVWHAAALIILCLATWLNLRAWFEQDLLPLGDFAGYASVIEQVRNALLRHGRVPLWCSECFAGSSYFVGSLKEYLAFPLALWLDPVQTAKLLYAILRVVSAFGLYYVFARLFAAPLAGIVAGYAFAFGAWSNHQNHYLDAALSAALLPPILLASVEMLRRRSRPAAVLLGFLTACLFLNSWVQALVGGVLFLSVLAFRPWRETASEDNPLTDHRLRAEWSKLVCLVLGVVLLLSLSHIVWAFADSGNHKLIDPEGAEEQRLFFSQRSPFLLLNRDNWMGDWLDSHDSLRFLPYTKTERWKPISELYAGSRYLGGVVTLLVVAGWFLARRRQFSRNWYLVGALVLLFQYWMALGPHTLVWQVARCFAWHNSVDTALSAGFSLLGVACLAGAWFAKSQRRLLLTCALLAVFPAWPLWEGLRPVVPMLELQRSPGHFADILPFSLSFLVGLALTAVRCAVANPAAANLAVATLGLLVAIDYWPSRSAFEEGMPLDPVREARTMVADLAGEDGTLRLSLIHNYEPIQALIATGSDLGWVRGWLWWQGGRYWLPYADRACWRFRPGTWKPPPGTSEALLEIGRIRYFLLDEREGETPPPPWRLLRSGKPFSLWEQPDVGPMAVGYRSFVLMAGGPVGKPLALVPTLFDRNVLVTSVDRLADHPELVRAASVIFSFGPWEAHDDASKIIAKRHAHKLFQDNQTGRSWQTALPQEPPRPLVAVEYARPTPEEIHLSFEVGDEPAQVFVAEGYHPWWRAAVDGKSAPVVRAQMSFMAVPAPPGAHAIELRFKPPILVRLADWLSKTAWMAAPVVAVLLALRTRRIRNRTRAQMPAGGPRA